MPPWTISMFSPGNAASAPSRSSTRKGSSGAGPSGSALWTATVLMPRCWARSRMREARLGVVHPVAVGHAVDDVHRVQLQPDDAVLLDEAVDLLEGIAVGVEGRDGAVQRDATGVAVAQLLADPHRRTAVVHGPELRDLVEDRRVGAALGEERVREQVDVGGGHEPFVVEGVLGCVTAARATRTARTASRRAG